MRALSDVRVVMVAAVSVLASAVHTRVATADQTFVVECGQGASAAVSQDDWDEAAGLFVFSVASVCMEMHSALSPCLYGHPLIQLNFQLMPYDGKWVMVRGPLVDGIECRFLHVEEITIIDEPTPTATASPTSSPTPTDTPASTPTPHPCGAADLNGDNAVDWLDIGILSGAYGSTSGDAYYRADCDWDNDGDVDWLDIAPFSGCYGTSW